MFLFARFPSCLCMLFLAFVSSFHVFFSPRFHGSPKGCLMPSDYWLPGCYREWVFLAFFLGFRFTFYLGPIISSLISLLTLKNWQPIPVLPRSPFGIPWLTSLPSCQQGSEVLAVFLYCRFMSPPLNLQCYRRTRFSLLWVFGPGFKFWQVSGYFGTY